MGDAQPEFGGEIDGHGEPYGYAVKGNDLVRSFSCYIKAKVRPAIRVEWGNK